MKRQFGCQRCEQGRSDGELRKQTVSVGNSHHERVYNAYMYFYCHTAHDGTPTVAAAGVLTLLDRTVTLDLSRGQGAYLSP